MTLDAEAIVRVDSINDHVRTRILNASGNGLLLAVPALRPMGTRMRITVQIADPMYEITVAGVIVHGTSRRATGPSDLPYAVGIYLTDVGPDWLALCRRLAKLGPAER